MKMDSHSRTLKRQFGHGRERLVLQERYVVKGAVNKIARLGRSGSKPQTLPHLLVDMICPNLHHQPSVSPSLRSNGVNNTLDPICLIYQLT